MKNPVAKFSNEFNKPKTFRDRKKHPSKAQQREYINEHVHELHHQDAEPYKRVNKGNMHRKLEEEDVSNEWYMVFQRYDKWWWTDLDDPLRKEEGPYDSDEEAHTAALHYGQQWSM